ncbi:MAG TPA: GLUG motif-containing protein [Rhizomicrobium sp.]|nr:GLUG motif-containing protein [Rhizomicrobium sp.]
MSTRLRAPLKCGASFLAIALVCSGASSFAGQLPGHGHFVAGQGAITKSGGVLTIDQSSRAGIVDWKSFSVGKANSVIFDNGNGATLNIVKGGNLSRISGDLHGTGSVYLLNRSGVLIGKTGVIDTQGSFVASSRNADESAFSRDGHLRLAAAAKGNVINRGAIASNASVTLYGAVTRAGTVNARNSVETSGEAVRLDGAAISAKSWLIDPMNLTVDAAAAKTIDTALGKGTNVTLKTTNSGATGPGVQKKGDGDIIVAAPITWSTKAKLTLDSFDEIDIDREIHLKGLGELVLSLDNGDGLATWGKSGTVTFDHTTAKFVYNNASYTLAGSIANLADDIAGHPSGHFALARNYDASADGTYDSSPISTNFKGTFLALNHTISNLSIDDPTSAAVGLFARNSGAIANLHLTNASVTGLADGASVGAVAGINNEVIFYTTVSGHVLGGSDESKVGGVAGDSPSGIVYSTSSASVTAGGKSFVGGLVGYAEGAIYMSSSSGAVAAGNLGVAGGLVGYTSNAVLLSHASGRVDGDDSATLGGLVGELYQGQIDESYATGVVAGGGDSAVGGLVGNASNDSSIDKSYAMGRVTASGDVGGLIGDNDNSTVVSSHATGEVDGGVTSDVGGLIGLDTSGIIQKSYASGRVRAGSNINLGGLIGAADGDNISNSYATGAVIGGSGGSIGGLIGEMSNSAKAQNVHATGAITAEEGGEVGGAVGIISNGTLTLAYATGSVTAAGGVFADGGGLVGLVAGDGTVSKSFATGNVVGSGGSFGGFVGHLDGTITDAYARGNVSGVEDSNIGGFAGDVDGGTISTSYSAGGVTSDTGFNAGAFVGFDDAGSYSHDYWDKTTSNTGNGVGNEVSVAGITGLTNAQLKGGTPVGFNTTIWGSAASKNGGLPYLKANPPPP